MTGPLPSIALVTPSFEKGRFLEATIRSVLDQNYPSLEYAVVDGGSKDGSRDVLARYADRLAWWASEPDGGQYDAINKGFAHVGGDVMGWLNADDMHTPWTLAVVGDIFRRLPEVAWLTTLFPLVWNADGLAVRCRVARPFSRKGFMRGENLPGLGWHAGGWVQQESTFWRRSLWEAAGGRVDANIPDAADFDLWARFMTLAEPHAVEVPLAGFRRYGDQKTGTREPEYKAQALAALARHGGRPASAAASALRLALTRAVPNRLRPLAFRLRVLTPGNVIVHDNAGNWRIERR